MRELSTLSAFFDKLTTHWAYSKSSHRTCSVEFYKRRATRSLVRADDETGMRCASTASGGYGGPVAATSSSTHRALHRPVLQRM